MKSAVACASIDGFARAAEFVSTRLNSLAELVVWLAVAATIAITFLQVIFRYGLDASLSWSEECARYLFVWIIFIGMSVATRRRQHIVVEVFVGLLPRQIRKWADVAGTIFCLLFFGVFAYVGVLLMLNAWQQYSTALELRIAWVYVSAPVGAALSIVHLIAGWSQRYVEAEPRPQ